MGDAVRLEREGAVGRIVLARPDLGNAINPDVAERLCDLAGACASDPKIRAVTITSEGNSFCVGGDLSAFRAVSGARRTELLLRMADRFHAAQLRILTMPKPVIIAVQGAVAGAGLGLALVGDIVLASSAASFRSAYTAVGLSADGGTTFLLPRLVGMRRAQQLLLTDRRLSAAEALAWGLVTEVVSPQALDAETVARARALAKGPTTAYGTIKQLLLTSLHNDFARQTESEGRHIAHLAAGADASEGIAAFLEKRSPSFRGNDA